MCLAQGPQRSDAGEARTRGPDFEKSSTYFKMACIQNVHLFNVFGLYLERYSVR